MTEQDKSIVTQELLKAISQRLSGRSDCKGVNYVVKIDYRGVSMTPHIFVFPNRYQRREVDKLDVVSYIHSKKFSNIRLDDLVEGTYIYTSTFDNTRRKWIKKG